MHFSPAGHRGRTRSHGRIACAPVLPLELLVSTPDEDEVDEESPLPRLDPVEPVGPLIVGAVAMPVSCEDVADVVSEDGSALPDERVSDPVATEGPHAERKATSPMSTVSRRVVIRRECHMTAAPEDWLDPENS